MNRPNSSESLDRESSRTEADRKNGPDVLHIGFSKCASTYLRALFRAHPGVHLVFKSGFFVPFLAGRMTFADYQALFPGSAGRVHVESDEHLTLPGFHPELGVRTTNLAEFAQVADKIREYLPTVRIIMVIRNQASLIVSRYSEYLIGGGSLGFPEFTSKLMGNQDAGNAHYQNYYSSIIRILEDRFPKPHVLVLMQETMREDEARTVRLISDFIGLSETLTPERGLRAERRSLSRGGMALLRWLNRRMVKRPSMASAPPETHVPIYVYRNVVRLVRALDYLVLGRLSPGPSSLLSEARRNAILRHFHDDNLRLQDYFGRDLGRLGYFGSGMR
jgi:hypothetical protein